MRFRTRLGSRAGGRALIGEVESDGLDAVGLETASHSAQDRVVLVAARPVAENENAWGRPAYRVDGDVAKLAAA